MPHVADQPDLTAADAEWRNDWARLQVPVTQRASALRRHYEGTGNVQSYGVIYEETLALREGLQVLKDRETSILKKLKENRDAWHDAVSTRTGRLGELDALVTAQERDMSSKQETIGALEMQRRELEGSAKYSLKTTQDQELGMTQSFKDDAISSLSDREQKVKNDVLLWKRQVKRTSNEQQSRQNELRKTQDSLEERRLALIEADAVSKTTASSNEDVSNHLKSARSILQSLANGIGSTADSTSGLVDLDVLATFIIKRFINLQQCYVEKTRILAACLEHTDNVENKIEATMRQQRELTTSLKQSTERLEASKETALSVPNVHLQNEPLLRELNENKRAKNNQIMKLKHKDRSEDINELQQDLDISRKELRTSITSVAPTDKDNQDPRQQIQDPQETVTHENPDLNRMTLDLSRLRRTRSAQIRDLNTQVTRHATKANVLRKQLHKLQISSDAESRRLQQILDSERLTIGEISQKVEQQRRDLEKNQVQIRDQEAALASKEKELARIKEGMERLKRSADSGMDQLEYERDQAEKERDQIEEELRESRAEVRELRADHAPRRQTGTGRQRLTGPQARRPRDASADHEDEESADLIIPQRDRKSVTGVHGQTDAPRRSGRKRKSGDMASHEE